LRETALAQLDEPLAYDGYSAYDQQANQLMRDAATAFIETFGKVAPALVFTNLFHLAELELAGQRSRLPKANKTTH